MDYNKEYLGRDELAPGMLFYRLIDPTDLDKAVAAMYRTIKADFDDKYIGWDSNKIYDFLNKYVILSREWRIPLTVDTKYKYTYAFVHRFKYTNTAAQTYTDAFISSVQQRTIPYSVIYPYNYKPTEVHTDLRKYVIMAGLIAGGYIIISTSIKKGVLKKALRK